MNGLTNIHWLLFGSFTLCITVAFLATVHPQRDLRFWSRLAGALVVGSLVLLPFLLPYQTVAEMYGMRRIRTEVEGGSAEWSDWLVANTRNLVYGRLWTINERSERRLFPGGVAIALAVAITGDYVFALPRNGRGWERLRSAGKRDAAGFTDDQNLERLLTGKTTYNSNTFGRIEAPRQDDDVHGPLTVSGWALSPNGIARVVVRVHSGRHVYAAALRPRPDVNAAFPWYARTPNSGFFVVLPKRPKGVPRNTDVQVEITDGSGNVMRLPDRLLTWD